MSLDNFLIMRHELLLTVAALLILIAEFSWNPESRKSVSLFSVALFTLITIVGFFPSPAGTLFGGMYEVN